MGRLIGLGYKAQTGKDTVAGMLGEVGFQRFAFADPLKKVLIEMDPVVERGMSISVLLAHGMPIDEIKKIPGVRSMLQGLGVGARKYIHQGVWVGATMREVDKVLKADGDVVITDVRFPNEVEAVSKRLGTLVRVDRAGTPDMPHISEHALDDFDDWDFVIDNDGSLAKLKLTVQDAFGVDLGVTYKGEQQEIEVP